MPHLGDVKTVQLCQQTRDLLTKDYGFLTLVVDRSDGTVSIASDFSAHEQVRQILTFALKNLDDTDTDFFPADNSQLN